MGSLFTIVNTQNCKPKKHLGWAAGGATSDFSPALLETARSGVAGRACVRACVGARVWRRKGRNQKAPRSKMVCCGAHRDL